MTSREILCFDIQLLCTALHLLFRYVVYPDLDKTDSNLFLNSDQVSRKGIDGEKIIALVISQLQGQIKTHDPGTESHYAI